MSQTDEKNARTRLSQPPVCALLFHPDAHEECRELFDLKTKSPGPQRMKTSEQGEKSVARGLLGGLSTQV